MPTNLIIGYGKTFDPRAAEQEEDEDGNPVIRDDDGKHTRWWDPAYKMTEGEVQELFYDGPRLVPWGWTEEEILEEFYDATKVTEDEVVRDLYEAPRKPRYESSPAFERELKRKIDFQKVAGDLPKSTRGVPIVDADLTQRNPLAQRIAKTWAERRAQQAADRLLLQSASRGGLF